MNTTTGTATRPRNRATQSRLRMTVALATAIGADAGTGSMRKDGRTVWNEDDWNRAANTAAALLAEPEIAAAPSTFSLSPLSEDA